MAGQIFAEPPHSINYRDGPAQRLHLHRVACGVRPFAQCAWSEVGHTLRSWTDRPGLGATHQPRRRPSGARNWGSGSGIFFYLVCVALAGAATIGVFFGTGFICSRIRRKKLSPIPVHAIGAV